MASGESDIGKIIADAAFRQEMELADLRKERDATPYEVPEIRSTDDESYNASLSPAQAIAALGLSSHELAVTQFERELKAGRVEALCHQAKIFLETEAYSTLRAIIDPWVWHLSFPAADSDFWETGYFRVLVPSTLGRSGWQGDIEFFQVRFWPDGLPGGSDNPLPTSARQDTVSAQAPLPQAEAERVSRAILQIWTSAVTERRAVELARGMCSDHRVSRDPFLEIFRAIRGDKRPGKQPLNGK